MKAKAPEKVYVHKTVYLGFLAASEVNITGNDVEYIRADASIEKACDAYCKVCGHNAHTTPTHICRQACDYYKDFKQAIMKL